MTKEEAKQRAIEEATEAHKHTCDPVIVKMLVGGGFDAGYQHASEWVPVEVRLPENGQEVWVTRRSDGEVVARTFDLPFTADDFVQFFSAWMPRQTEPEPYQGGE